MEPIGLAFSASLAVAKGVAAWLKGSASAVQLQQLGVRYWGLVLHEMRENIDSLSANLQQRPRDASRVPVLCFTYSDALLTELARMSPFPKVLSAVAKIFNQHRIVQRYIDLATNADMAGFTSGVVVSRMDATATWVAFVRDFLPDHLRDFSELRDSLESEGSKAYKQDWEELRGSILPEVIEA